MIYNHIYSIVAGNDLTLVIPVRNDLTNQLIKRYQKGIFEQDKNKIGMFIQEARTRMSQSIKSFATLYYKSSKEGRRIRNPYESEDDNSNVYQYEDMQKVDRLIEEIAKSITVYKQSNIKALNDAKKISKIKTSLSILLAKEVSDISNLDNLKHIYRLFLKDLKNVNKLCGTMYFTYVKKLMSIKRTTEIVYFKQQINVLLMKLLVEIKYEDKYKTLTSQSQFNINTFLAYYITMILRDALCGQIK